MPLRKRKKGGFYRLDSLTPENEWFKVIGITSKTGEVSQHGTFPTEQDAIVYATKQLQLNNIVYWVLGQDGKVYFSTER